jgi:protein-S-isoprenylcysteine O-methyltransferase Ste14
MHRRVAWTWGVLTHAGFVLAVVSMAWALARGMHVGLGRLEGVRRVLANGALLLQFPLLHSGLLSRRGGRVLSRLAPSGMGRALSSTTFAALAALQLAATFWLWSPGSAGVWRASGVLAIVLLAAHVLAWVFLVVALHDAGLGLQTGWIGWRALLQGRDPAYPPMPERGLFALCRQPIYLGFLAVLWTGPTWSVDRLALGGVWGVYCLLAPRLKERRHARIHGERFAEYRRRVPYMIPRMFA